MLSLGNLSWYITKIRGTATNLKLNLGKALVGRKWEALRKNCFFYSTPVFLLCCLSQCEVVLAAGPLWHSWRLLDTQGKHDCKSYPLQMVLKTWHSASALNFSPLTSQNYRKTAKLQAKNYRKKMQKTSKITAKFLLLLQKFYNCRLEGIVRTLRFLKSWFTL